MGAVIADIGHLVRHDEVVLGLHRHLHIVADGTGAFAAGGVGAGVWISQRDLLVGRGLHLLLHLLQRLHRPAQALDLLLEVGRLGLSLRARLPIGAIQSRQVAGDAGFELLHKPYAVENVSRVLRRVTRRNGAG